MLVFIHGYNTGFDDGVYRVTQIAHDTRYPGTPILFSWASGAKTRDYVYDKDSSTAARDDLEETLVMLSKSRSVKSIDIIAHSMGNWLAMETLRQLAIAGNRDLDGKLGYVVLASPDIDVDIFKKQMKRYGKPDRPFVSCCFQQTTRHCASRASSPGRKPASATMQMLMNLPHWA